MKFGEALLTTADVKTTNGVIHVIDTVIIPPPVKKSDILSREDPDKGECDETGCTPSVGPVNMLKYTEAELQEMLKHTGAKITVERESRSDRKKALKSDSENKPPTLQVG